MSRVVIAGAGAAGLMAAIHAAGAGAFVTVVDRNEKAGRKIYITGKGRCNCTNDCTEDEFLREVVRNPRFLYSALNFFSPRDLISLLEGAGCPVTVQRGRRVFPASEKASDVTRALLRLCAEKGVRIVLKSRISEVLLQEGRASGLRLENGEVLPADAVILATGGLSYPGTGSTGDGFRMAAALGHRVLPPRPSLSALETEESWPASLQGLSLRNVTVTLDAGGRPLVSEPGEMLFTHFGVSGPLVLEASCHLPDDFFGDAPPPVHLLTDLKPGLSPEQLDARLLREFSAAGRKQLKNVLPALLPQRIAALFPALCGLPEDLACSGITVPQRQALVRTLKALPVTVRRCRPLEEAIVTRGGVSVREIRPSTMESRLVPGLYLAGELLDVDAHTGGYNLQIAFSTGALAGYSAASCGA